MAVEAKRGCGYRKVNGLYLVGGGLSAPCDRMPFPLERCKVCGGGIKFTRGPQWLLPSFFEPHLLQEERVFHTYRETDRCLDESPCPVCNKPPLGEEFGPHLLLWIGRKHYTPEAYLEEGRRLGVSRRLSALPKGLVLGQTWVLLAHLDAVPPRQGTRPAAALRDERVPARADLARGGVREDSVHGHWVPVRRVRAPQADAWHLLRLRPA